MDPNLLTNYRSTPASPVFTRGLPKPVAKTDSPLLTTLAAIGLAAATFLIFFLVLHH